MGGMAFFMAIAGGLSATAGGINASKQQDMIKQEVCQIAQQMQTYKTMMLDQENILQMAAAQTQSQADDLLLQISSIKQSILQRHADFKKTYNYWVVASIVFLILLVFIFASKKLILHASTERS